MDPIFRVLGYAQNPVLVDLLQKSVLRTEADFRRIVEIIDPGRILSELLSEPNFPDFFKFPDVSAIVAKSRDFPLEKTELKFLCRSAMAFVQGNRIEDSDCVTIEPGGVVMSPVDGNPFNSYDAHPDNRKDGIGVGWGDRDPSEWKKSYSEAFRILRVADLGFFEEIRQFLRKIVPLGTDPSAHRSASYAEAFGCVYMGFTPLEKYPEHSILEGLIHEWSHNKANLIAANVGPLLSNDRKEEYYSAYRPDPRPISGIFLWVHAFVPAVRVFLNAFETGAIPAETRIEKVFSMHLKNCSAISVLRKYLLPTQEGRILLHEIESAHSGNDVRISNYRSKFADRAASAEALFIRHFNKAVSDFPFIRS